jgi:hypothetical protein
MSIVDERDLRQQLDGALDAIMPPDAPVRAAARRGKLIQAGRSLGIVAGLAVVAGMGVGLPGLLNQPAHEVSHARPTVMLEQTCATSAHGVRQAVGGAAPGSERAEPLSPAQTAQAGGQRPAELATRGCAWLKP